MSNVESEARAARRRDLERIFDLGWVYAMGGVVVYESIIESRFPGIDVPTLCDLYGDSIGDEQTAIRQYLDMFAPESAEQTGA